MENYFRITAYNPKEDISAILDSYGCYEKVWQFSSFLVKKGFNIIFVGNTSKFSFGNIPEIPYNTNNIILRACAKGKPIITDKQVQVGNKTYSVI